VHCDAIVVMIYQPTHTPVTIFYFYEVSSSYFESYRLTYRKQVIKLKPLYAIMAEILQLTL